MNSILIQFSHLLTIILVVILNSNVIGEPFLPQDPFQGNDWEPNPNIFTTWSKDGLEESKWTIKSPPRSEIHAYLPATTKPIEYEVRIRIILESTNPEEELTAPGTVRILTKCLQSTNQIVMHVNTKYVNVLQDTVKVTETILGKPVNIRLPVVNQTFDTETAFYTIHLATPCKVNWDYLVEIGFIAQVATDTLTGLYFSNYTDPATNVTKRLATTQFEAEHARQMFPNYDDPDYKASFKLIIGRFHSYNSLSNMNLIKTELNKDLPGWVWDHYAPTPVMSSYLVAVIVSDFICVNAPLPGYIKPVDVCGPQYMIREGGGVHSADVVAKILAFYDKFMGHDYPLPKMTSVAIPHFAAGAMENYGVNTYRIKGLIYYPGTTSEEARYRIDLTIAHELAHQNFGNLVTCKLWNQIWLNEGFATYISYYGLQSVSPEYNPETQWMTGYRRRALALDASVSTHPLVNVTSPMFYFDGVSYSKGASLLRMLENFITEEVLHEALHVYLGNHKFGTATQWDLFDVIDQQAVLRGVQPSVGSVTQIMESWSLQAGFPLIRVEYLSNGSFLISQERFFNELPEGGKDESSLPPTFWYIPIWTHHDKSGSPLVISSIPKIWLTPFQPTQVITLGLSYEWIIVNPDASAFGRVIYDDRIIEKIKALLDASHEAVSGVTRAQILEDAFEVAWAGYGQIETALDFTKYLHKELEPVVWTVALNALGKINSMFVEIEEANTLFKNYVFPRLSSSLSSFGVVQSPEDIGITVTHRGSMLHWAGMLEMPEALQYASESVNAWAETSVNRVPADLHSPTYCNAIIAGGRNTYDTIFNLFKKETDEDIKQALARSLGCSKHFSTLDELRMNLTNPDSGLSTSASEEIIQKLSRNVASRTSLLSYLDKNFQELKDYFGGIDIFGKTLQTASFYWNTERHLEELQNFFDKYKDEFEDVEKATKRLLKQVKRNIAWMEKFAGPITAWLRANQS